MTNCFRVRLLAVVAVLVAASAAAQTRSTANDWSHGTILSVSAGAGFDGDHTGFAAGMGLGWEVLPWFGVEGSGTWMDRGRDATAFAAAMKGQFPLMPGRRVVPFVEGGVGLYRVSSTDSEETIQTFTDPSLVVGGGVSLFLTRHLALRPAVETAFVRRDSQTHQVTTAAVRLTYHFEDHQVTPSR